MLTVTKRFEFDYAHKLPNYAGKCSNLHGHTGILEIEVNGCNGAKTDGMIADFLLVRAIVQTNIIEHLDHAYLNDFIPNPTAENIIIWIRDKLDQTTLGPYLIRIRLYETSNSWAEWIYELT